MGKTTAPVKIGPEMPSDLPTLRHDDVVDAPLNERGQKVVVREENGMKIETIVSVQVPRREERQDVAARVKRSYRDTNGFLIEQY